MVVNWYGPRPIVEEFHKGMKTGCGIETLQFTTEGALQPVIALLSVVAAFLLQLRNAGHDPATAARPATPYVPVSYSEVLCSWRHGEVPPGWTVAVFYSTTRDRASVLGHKNCKKFGELISWQ